MIIMTVPFAESLSERWLLERMYHAQLRNGRELPVPALTLAMKQIPRDHLEKGKQSHGDK